MTRLLQDGVTLSYHDPYVPEIKVSKQKFTSVDLTNEVISDSDLVVIVTDHLLLYQSAIAWIRDYLATGKAAKVLHIATQLTKLGRVRREENVWWSFAPHDISVVLDLLGNPTLKTVKGSGQAMLQPGIEDNVHVDLSFEGGQTAHIHCS